MPLLNCLTLLSYVIIVLIMNSYSSKSTKTPPSKENDSGMMPWSIVLAPIGLFLLLFSREDTSLLAWGLGLTFASLMRAKYEKHLGAAIIALLSLALRLIFLF